MNKVGLFCLFLFVLVVNAQRISNRQCNRITRRILRQRRRAVRERENQRCDDQCEVIVDEDDAMACGTTPAATTPETTTPETTTPETTTPETTTPETTTPETTTPETTTPETTTPETTTPETTTSETTTPETTTPETTTPETTTPEITTPDPMCAVSSQSAYSCTVCGVKTPQNTRPWHVIIRAHYGDATLACAGALVSDKYVITTANCVQSSPDSVQVIIGNTTVPGVPDYSVHLYAKNIIMHPNYADSPTNNNLALLEIMQIEYSSAIQPICLPSDESVSGTVEVDKPLESVSAVHLRDSDCSESTSTSGCVLSMNLCSDVVLGSPVTKEDGNRIGKHALIGLINNINDDDDCIDPWSFTRISNFVSWIRSLAEISPSCISI